MLRLVHRYRCAPCRHRRPWRIRTFPSIGRAWTTIAPMRAFEAVTAGGSGDSFIPHVERWLRLTAGLDGCGRRMPACDGLRCLRALPDQPEQ